MTPLSVSTCLDIRFADRLGAAAFVEAVSRTGVSHVRRRGFAATALRPGDVAPLGDVILVDEDGNAFDVVLALDSQTVAHVSVSRGEGRLAVASREPEAVDAVTDDLVRFLRDTEPAEHVVPVTFWSASAGGYPSSSRRDIEAPAWEEVQGNYAPRTGFALDDLMEATGPGPGGLLLWHGDPGTGKSFAVRALARAWQGWCETHVVTNPELFFSASTDHLVGGMLRRTPHDRWRLFVVEDSGEYLAADARAVAGQAVSRILNLTDGLLGAGLRSLVLVTTNEPLRRVHPALARPGRCWAQVAFEPLPAARADAWLAERGSAARVGGPTALADLYAALDGRTPASSVPVGFVRSAGVAAT